jgi:cell division septal protein FtsQ
MLAGMPVLCISLTARELYLLMYSTAPEGISPVAALLLPVFREELQELRTRIIIRNKYAEEYLIRTVLDKNIKMSLPSAKYGS